MILALLKIVLLTILLGILLLIISPSFRAWVLYQFINHLREKAMKNDFFQTQANSQSSSERTSENTSQHNRRAKSHAHEKVA